MNLKVVGLLVGMVSLTPTMAQVSVRQASNAELVFKEFHSPVTVEADLSAFIAAPADEEFTVPSPGSFYCDGVTIEHVVLEKTLPNNFVNGSTHELSIGFKLRARKQVEDMLADVEFSLIRGERVYFLGKVTDLEVEAGDRVGESETYKLSPADFDSLLREAPAPLLRITMSTRPA